MEDTILIERYLYNRSSKKDTILFNARLIISPDFVEKLKNYASMLLAFSKIESLDIIVNERISKWSLSHQDIMSKPHEHV